VVISGLKRLVKNGLIKPDELTVAYITGNGLKTQEVVASAIKPVHISPSYDAFEEAMAER
ncbi:MAG TPA: threonine synthase, partial [SAR202 cluster bacterium]|nr:threonine synthase [SAR202 cluster bacterium]